mgnify:FL=1
MITKKILKAFLICILVYVVVILASCNTNTPTQSTFGSTDNTEPKGELVTSHIGRRSSVVNTTSLNKTRNIEYITGRLSNSGITDTGLYKVTLNDGREILIYKGSDYATMIQLK